MNSKKLPVASILSAMLIAGPIAAIGSITTTFAQSDDDDIWDDDSSMTSGNTTTTSSNMTKLSGVIASLQNNDAGAPEWITAGHWQLESDRSLFGNDTAKPQVSNFSAVIYMTSIANGSNMHQHEISDFMQTSVLHSGENVTTINGTFTISMSDGPNQNTSGYIRLQNNMISLWTDPTGIDEHFGPTPVYGLIVPGDKMMYHGGDDRDDTATAGLDDDGGLRGDGSVDDDPSNQSSGTVTQGTSGADDLYDD